MPCDAGCEELWAATLDKAESALPVGLMPILSDPAQVRCEFTDDTMTLFVVPGFSYNFINNNDILMRLRSAAAEVTGRSLKIRLCEDNGNGKTVRSLDELAQFAETRFI